MRVLVTGARGLLGTSLLPRLAARHEVLGLDLADGDLLAPGFFRERMARFHPQAIVHLAALTDVDRCEMEPEEAFRVNEGATRVVGEAAAPAVPVLALSTDYVFDGTAGRPYREEDPPRPANVYGRSKLAGERALAASGAPWTVVRTAWLYGPGGRNFVDTILSLLATRDTLEVVDDQRGCPTYAPDLAAALVTLLERGARGLYHVAGGGEASWFDLARAAAGEAGLDGDRIRPVPTSRVPRPAPRPPCAVLDCSKAEREHGVRLRPWREALADYLAGRDAGKGDET